jgi:hypothetical protein
MILFAGNCEMETIDKMKCLNVTVSYDTLLRMRNTCAEIWEKDILTAAKDYLTLFFIGDNIDGTIKVWLNIFLFFVSLFLLLYFIFFIYFNSFLIR